MREKIESILKREGIFSIVAQGDNFPHIVNSWNSYVIYRDNAFFVPVAGMIEMERFLNKNSKVIVVIGTKELMGLYGMGMGIKIIANATIETDTPEHLELKSTFEWARAAMKIEILEAYQTT